MTLTAPSRAAVMASADIIEEIFGDLAQKIQFAMGPPPHFIVTCRSSDQIASIVVPWIENDESFKHASKNACELMQSGFKIRLENNPLDGGPL